MKEHKIIKIDQELYILSDEPIEKDSWFTDGKGVYFCEILLDGYIGFKKIIASTDTLMLSQETSDYLPLITQEFKKYYLENPTETVMVEYENIWYKNMERNIPTGNTSLPHIDEVLSEIVDRVSRVKLILKLSSVNEEKVRGYTIGFKECYNWIKNRIN